MQAAVYCSPNRTIRSWDGRSPLSIAAAIIFLLTRLPGVLVRPSINDIAQAVGVSDSTIRLVFSELRPYAADLVPHTAASKEDIKKLT